MKIVFICGCLEEGRDGVGDYCRRLAAACAALGVDTALLALNDRFVAHATSGPSLLRLPRDVPWSERRERAAEFLAEQRMDWVSLQFVSYALAPNGVIFRWGKRLADLLRGQQVQLMLHELWIGESTEYGFTDRLIGTAQKFSLKHLIRCVQPAVIHTTNRLYQDLLAGIGVRAGRLRLPGNIPLPLDASAELPAAMRGIARSQSWLAGIFGTIHARWSPEPWLAELCNLSEQAGRKLVLVQLGEAGSGGRRMWERMAAEYRVRAEFIACGPLDARAIAHILHELDFGLATSPWALIEKSGSTAAFLERGIPVLVPRDDWQRRASPAAAPAADPLLVRTPAALVRTSRRAPAARLPEIARRQLHGLRGTP